MLGIPDISIWGAYLLCVLSAVACVVYGLVNWNRGGENESRQIDEESRWQEQEKQVEENL
jgi:hypothetical protein